MSKTLSIFVGSEPSIEECRNLVEGNLRIHLTESTASEGFLFEGEVSGAGVALFDNHGRVDDCGIEFTRFPVEIDFTRYAGTNGPDWDDTTFVCLAVSLAKKLSKQLRSQCIVVEDLQRIVQSFGPPVD